jgi:hypothetical protein
MNKINIRYKYHKFNIFQLSIIIYIHTIPHFLNIQMMELLGLNYFLLKLGKNEISNNF